MDLGEENSASRGSAEQKALFNDIILDAIFKHVCKKESYICQFSMDVQNVRLVCKTWCESMTRVVRSVMPTVHLNSPNCLYADETLNMREILDLMKNSILIPVESYNISSSIFMMENPQLLIADFIEICGPTAVKIQFDWDYVPYDLTPVTPNFQVKDWQENRNVSWERLKTLDIRGSEKPELTEATSAFFHLIRTILAIASNLETFRFQWSGLPDNKIGILGLLPATIKNLELSEGCLHNSGLEIFSGKGLRVKKLHLELNGAPRDFYSSETLQFLQMQSEVMEELIIGDSAVTLQGFPPMKELVRLELRTDEALGQRPVSISDIFPKLQVLDLTYLFYRKHVELFLSSKEVAPSVSELFLPKLEIRNDTEEHLPFPFVEMAAKKFPNLTKLHLHIRKDANPGAVFQEIFTLLPALQHLTLQGNISYLPATVGSTSVEFLLSGVSEGDYQEIIRRPRISHKNLDDFDTQPSILSLKKLKILFIDAFEYHHRGNSQELTKFSALLFSRLPHLEELYLRGIKVSSEFTRIMRTKNLKVLDICSTKYQCYPN